MKHIILAMSSIPFIFAACRPAGSTLPATEEPSATVAPIEAPVNPKIPAASFE